MNTSENSGLQADGSLSEAVEHRLRVEVERVVRPVIAADGRKDRMRADLLAHLVDGFRQEAGGEPSDALAATLRRFGAPAELTKELQQSVPAWERLAFLPLPGLTAWRASAHRGFAARPVRTAMVLSLMQAAASTLVAAVVYSFCIAFNQHRPIPPAGFVLIFGALLLVSADCFFFMLLLRRLREAMGYSHPSQRSPPLAALVLSVGAALAAASAILLAAGVNWKEGYAFIGLNHWPIVLAVSVATPILMWIGILASQADYQRWQQWEALELSD